MNRADKVCKAFIIGHEVSKDHPDAGTFSTGPNQWPRNLPDEVFRAPVMKYQAQMLALSKVILKLLARGLPKEWGHSPDVMDAFGENEPSMPMRLLHYAPTLERDEAQFGGKIADFCSK